MDRDGRVRGTLLICRKEVKVFGRDKVFWVIECLI